MIYRWKTFLSHPSLETILSPGVHLGLDINMTASCICSVLVVDTPASIPSLHFKSTVIWRFRSYCGLMTFSVVLYLKTFYSYWFSTTFWSIHNCMSVIQFIVPDRSLLAIEVSHTRLSDRAISQSWFFDIDHVLRFSTSSSQMGVLFMRGRVAYAGIAVWSEIKLQSCVTISAGSIKVCTQGSFNNKFWVQFLICYPALSMWVSLNVVHHIFWGCLQLSWGESVVFLR